MIVAGIFPKEFDMLYWQIFKQNNGNYKEFYNALSRILCFVIF